MAMTTLSIALPLNGHDNTDQSPSLEEWLSTVEDAIFDGQALALNLSEMGATNQAIMLEQHIRLLEWIFQNWSGKEA